MSMNANSNDTIGNRIRDLPACSAVPEPTAPPRASPEQSTVMKYPQTGGCYSVFKVNNDLAKNKLTPWNKVLFEKLSGPQLVKNFPAFYGTRMSIVAYTSSRHLSVSSARSIPSRVLKIHFIIILSSSPMSSKQPLSHRYPHQTPVFNSVLPTHRIRLATKIMLQTIRIQNLFVDLPLAWNTCLSNYINLIPFLVESLLVQSLRSCIVLDIYKYE